MKTVALISVMFVWIVEISTAKHEPKEGIHESLMEHTVNDDLIDQLNFKCVHQAWGSYLSWKEVDEVYGMELQAKSFSDWDFRPFQADVSADSSGSGVQFFYKVDPKDGLAYRLKLNTKEGYFYSKEIKVGVESKEQINIYPNPTSGNVRIDGQQITGYQLMDIRGQILLSGQPTSNLEVEMILSSELGKNEDGIYFLKISTLSGQETIQIRKK